MSGTIFHWTRDLITDWQNNRRVAIWSTSVLAILIRVGASLALKSYRFDPGDDHFAFGYEWGRIAQWLVERHMFSMDGSVPTSDIDPLYVFIIAPFFQAFGVFAVSAAIALIVFQSLLCGFSAWALFVLAEKLFGPVEARLSSLLFALYPASIFFAIGRIGPSSLSILLLCLIFLIVLDLPYSGRPIKAALGGFLMGLLFLASSHLLSLFLAIPFWLVLVGKGQRVRMTLMSLLFIGAAIAVLLPWSLRNSSVLGYASISKTNLGYHIWVGNSPGATGNWRTSKHPDAEFYKEHGSQPNYVRMAISWVKENPREFLILTLNRIKYFWYRISTDDGQKNSIGIYILHTCIFLAVVSLALLGVFWPAEKPEKSWLLLLFFAIYPLLFYLIHVTHYRHRFHIEPFVLIFASRGLHRLWTIFPIAKREPQALIKNFEVS